VSRWDQRFFESTRGQIVTLLRRARRTVDDLAGVLGLTDNAVRAHLTSLERDGLVRQAGVRRGERKPSQVFELTPEAEELFPKAHAPVLSRLVDALHDHLPEAEMKSLLAETGRRLGSGAPSARGDTRARLEAARGVLGALGGLAETEELPDGRLALRGLSCPLGQTVLEHPDLCQVAEALVSEASGVPVEEHCERPLDGSPRCLFVTSPSTS
jgi:predicted ArsR family transcriptional regulator